MGDHMTNARIIPKIVRPPIIRPITVSASRSRVLPVGLHHPSEMMKATIPIPISMTITGATFTKLFGILILPWAGIHYSLRRCPVVVQLELAASRGPRSSMVFKVDGFITQKNYLNDVLISGYREFERYERAVVPKAFLMRPR